MDSDKKSKKGDVYHKINVYINLPPNLEAHFMNAASKIKEFNVIKRVPIEYVKECQKNI